MKPDDIRFRSVEKTTADYLRTMKEPGAFNEAAAVTEAELKYLGAAVTEGMEHGKEGKMITQLKGGLSGKLSAGFELFGNGAKVAVIR